MDDNNSNDINNLKNTIIDNTIHNNQLYPTNSISNSTPKKKITQYPQRQICI